MARKKRVRKVVKEKVQMSSMIDVVFLILIYFIVTQTVILEETHLDSSLPNPDKIVDDNDEPDRSRIVSIGVTKTDDSSMYEMEGVYYSLDDLRDILDVASINDPETSIFIKCGPNARHQKLISLLDLCQEVELNNISILNDASISYAGNL